MKIIHSDEPLPNENACNISRSIFLAGPTPRDTITPSWRPDAIDVLEKHFYDGIVYIPEHKSKLEYLTQSAFDEAYLQQVEWENSALFRAQYIVFWVPRNLATMPAFTTNVEFGRFAHLSNTFYGRPDHSEKNKYLDWYYKKVNRNKIYTNLEEMLKCVLRTI